MTKTYRVKAIGPKIYRYKTFATPEEAHKYFVNLMNWKNRNHNTDYWTVWVDSRNNRLIKYTI